MILQNIWGFWLLLSIPVLIIIYIIKQEHKERAVSSTYLWRISERFLKKRLPLKRMTSLLAFLLQLILLSLLAFSAVQPAVALGQVAGHIVIIDASASMQTELDGVTRFEAAVSEAKAIAESGFCSSMTVIIASDTPACPVMGGSVSEALNALDNVSCSLGGVDLYETMKLTREAFARMGSAKVTFYTDTEYAAVENIELVDMRRGEKNVAITALTHTSGDFKGTLVSYGEDREVTVGLYIDDTIVDTRIVSCINGEPTDVIFETQHSIFEKATLLFDLEDALVSDNSYSVMGKRSETVSVLLTGRDTFFLEAGFKALGNCDVTLQNRYTESEDGAYDLYVFNGNIPTKDILPEKGLTLGFMQIPASNAQTMLSHMTVYRDYPDESGLTVRYGNLLSVDPLLEGMEAALEDIYVGASVGCWELDENHYIAIGRPPDKPQNFDWYPICEFLNRRGGNKAVACSRILDNGNRQYLFMFPLSESNLAMTPAFMMILENACKLASTPSIPQTHYAVGETVEITLKSDAENLTVVAPDKAITELNGQETTFIPTTPGIYTLTYDDHQQTREASFFVHIPVEEYETYNADTIYLSKTFERTEDGKMLSSTLLPLLSVILSALLIFEWGYHYRGKY